MLKKRPRATHLRSLPDNPISPEGFKEVIESQKTTERVSSSIGKLCKIGDYAIVEPVHVGYSPNDPGRYGSVQDITPGGARHLIGIGTSLGFPRSLHEFTGLSADQSMNLAADFIHSYGVFLRGQARNYRSSKHSFVASQLADLWQPTYAQQPLKAVPFRAAALVALQALNPDSEAPQPLEFDREEAIAPYPAHIAALQNPLLENEIRMMHEEMKKGV